MLVQYSSLLLKFVKIKVVKTKVKKKLVKMKGFKTKVKKLVKIEGVNVKINVEKKLVKIKVCYFYFAVVVKRKIPRYKHWKCPRMLKRSPLTI